MSMSRRSPEQDSRICELTLTAEDGDYDEVYDIIDSEGDAIVNYSDDYGHYPLQAACFGSHYEIVELLIEKGADVNQQDINGNTPLHSTSCIR